MKKRSFVAIFMVAVGLFLSVSLFASYEGHKGSHNTGSVNGTYVPD